MELLTSHKLHFVKYTIAGNTFVIVDEREGSITTEESKPLYARLLCDQGYGIGCNKVIFIQKATKKIFDELRQVQQYFFRWNSLDEVKKIITKNSGMTMIRPFNSNGRESFICCNSILAVHKYVLNAQSSKSPEFSYLTMIAGTLPRIIKVKSSVAGMYTVNIGTLEKYPFSFLNRILELPVVDSEKLVCEYAFNLNVYDGEQIEIAGYLVSVGEPHLILLTEADYDKFSFSHLSLRTKHIYNELFTSLSFRNQEILLKTIGDAVNDERDPILLEGLSVSFASIHKRDRTLWIRTYERNTRAEVSSCGTAAIAACAVGIATIPELDSSEENQFTVVPLSAFSEWVQRPVGVITKLNGDWEYGSRAEFILEGDILIK